MRFFFNNSKGYSLVELLIVILLITVLAGLSAVGMGFVRQQQVSRTTKQLLTDIQRARGDALMLRGSAEITLATTSYTVSAITGTGAAVSKTRTQILSANNQLSISTAVGSSAAATNNVVVLSNNFGYYPGAIVAIIISSPNLGTSYMRCIALGTANMREGFWNDTTKQCNPQ